MLRAGVCMQHTDSMYAFTSACAHVRIRAPACTRAYANMPRDSSVERCWTVPTRTRCTPNLLTNITPTNMA